MRLISQFGGRGPTHLEQEDAPGLTWCGAKAQFRHVTREGGKHEVDCLGCLSRMRKGVPLAWGAKR